VDLLGFVITVIALQLLPLFMVQAVVASSVGVTALAQFAGPPPATGSSTTKADAATA
jgi:hypothetical protein